MSVGVLHWAHQQPLRRLEVLPGSNANPRHHAAPQLRQFEIKQAGQRIELQPLGLVFTCFGEQFEEHVHASAYFTPSQARISRHGKPPFHGKTGRHFTHDKPTLGRVSTG